MDLSDGQKFEIAAFFGGREAMISAFMTLWGTLSAWEGVSLEIKRTQMSFRAGVLFGCVSVRGRRLALNFTLPEARADDRFFGVTEPYPGRFTHHMYFSTLDPLTREDLRIAYEYAQFRAAKRRPIKG